MRGITAFVLAGGKSSRMGSDKAFLDFAGRSLLEHTLLRAGHVADRVCIVGEREKFAAYGETLEDVYRDCGPLAGIQAALAGSSTDINLLLGVDLPFLEDELLAYLLSRARASSATVTVPCAEGAMQPLCAVYRRRFAQVAQESLERGQNRIDRLFTLVETQIVSEAELSRQGFSRRMFRNLNTPEDVKQAKAQALEASAHRFPDGSERQDGRN